MTMPPLTPADFEMLWDADHTFPFMESEDATIMAHGHHDKAEFVKIVRTYDDLNDPKWAETHAESDVEYHWAIRTDDNDEDGWWLSWNDVTAETPNAFPITVIRR